MRLDVTLQFQSLRRPIKQDESVALIARIKGGPLVAYVEVCAWSDPLRIPFEMTWTYFEMPFKPFKAILNSPFK